MDQSTSLEVMIPMVVSVAMFATIFGIFYLRNREKMAMIERGMDPRINDKANNRNYVLTWGMLLIGSGLGLFLAFVSDHLFYNAQGVENPPIYFGLISLFGGLGLFISYLIEKKEAKKVER
ncbi:MAG: hypothetical protein JWR50_285 [Mucilaginibacter sp.]|nr:hypothetical protein [Mucilaginibacter sp.]